MLGRAASCLAQRRLHVGPAACEHRPPSPDPRRFATSGPALSDRPVRQASHRGLRDRGAEPGCSGGFERADRVPAGRRRQRDRQDAAGARRRDRQPAARPLCPQSAGNGKCHGERQPGGDGRWRGAPAGPISDRRPYDARAHHCRRARHDGVRAAGQRADLPSGRRPATRRPLQSRGDPSRPLSGSGNLSQRRGGRRRGPRAAAVPESVQLAPTLAAPLVAVLQN